jgi:hypothetical protein
MFHRIFLHGDAAEERRIGVNATRRTNIDKAVATATYCHPRSHFDRAVRTEVKRQPFSGFAARRRQ